MLLALPARPGSWPWATLLVNLLGCLLLGVLTARAPSRRLAVLLGTGALGGFTTASAAALDARLLAERPAVAAAYLAATLVGGALAAAAGLRLGERR